MLQAGKKDIVGSQGPWASTLTPGHTQTHPDTRETRLLLPSSGHATLFLNTPGDLPGKFATSITTAVWTHCL